MTRLTRSIAALAMLLGLSAWPVLAKPPAPAPLTILISIDAFRADYLDGGRDAEPLGDAAGGARRPCTILSVQDLPKPLRPGHGLRPTATASSPTT